MGRGVTMQSANAYEAHMFALWVCVIIGILVFGANGKDARAVADAIAREAFHNVSFVDAPFEEILGILR